MPGTRIGATMGPLEWALLITLSVLWGGTFFFAEVALEEVRPLTLVFARVGLAAIALVLAVHATGQRMPTDVALWAAFFVMGALNNVIPFSLIFWGQTRITGGLAALLNATTPLFTVVVAHFLTRDERLTPHRLGGVLLGLLGVIVMIGPAVLRELGLQLLAQIAVLGAALSYALAAVFGRRFRDVPPLISAAGQVTATTIIMLPLVMSAEDAWRVPMLGLWTWGAILGLALLSTALAYLIYFRVLASAGATNLLLVTFLIPVSAIVLGATLLGERPDPKHFAGMALIGLGLGAIDGRPLRLLRRRAKRPPLTPAPVAPRSRTRPSLAGWRREVLARRDQPQAPRP
jgi:drug/metabolite transporter (DMT)-like permease